MTSPLNTLMQLQALQQSMQASWMRSQNVNRSEPEFAGQISSMMPSEHTNEGYSAEELLKFLEM